MNECIFCAITAGQSPATIEYQDADIAAFRDTNPQTPTHIIIIPVRHIADLLGATEADMPTLGKMLMVAKQLADKENLNDNGYRVVINQGLHAGQMVDHLHLHLLGGKELGPIA